MGRGEGQRAAGDGQEPARLSLGRGASEIQIRRNKIKAGGNKIQAQRNKIKIGRNKNQMTFSTANRDFSSA